VKDLAAYRFWGHAATFGALWGAVEMTAGSFLHALRVPFSGVVLAAVGAALLVTLRTLLSARGLVLAAGIVCAGVKLLSPAGPVLGPMLAILVESALVELALAPVGVNPVSSVVAGALATLWTVVQKLIAQTLLFGMPVLALYRGILLQAERVLHLPASGGAWAAGAFLGLVAAIGAGFGIAGALVGATASRQLWVERP
jgi:hypothetical protein